MSVFFPNVKKIFEPQISVCTRKYTYVQRFWRFLKENYAWFYENHLRRCEKSSLKYSIVLPNDNFSGQEFENFNLDQVDTKEPLGNDNNGEEEE